MSMIATGQPIPSVPLTIMGSEGPQGIDAADLLGEGRSVLFAVPGAFTPTCSAHHLPGFIELAGKLRAHGIDQVVCLAVNDIFVLDAWAKSKEAGDSVTMAADGNGDFARALGLEMDASAFGMGQRSQRFAMITQSGIVESLMVDAPGEFRVSSAEYVLEHL